MDSPIRRVFIAYEPSYWRGMLCTLGSLARNAAESVSVEVMMRREHVHSCQDIFDKIPNTTRDRISITPLVMSNAALRECESFKYEQHFKPEICFRLYYFDLSGLDGNAVYIDIDTIFRTSISELSTALPENAPLAARSHENLNSSIRAVAPDLDRYFNSGVLLFNVEKFAEEVVARLQDSRRILHEIHAKSSFLDQDALNLAFRGRWEELPARFNYMSIDQSPLDLDSGYILHATGSRKPWMLGGRHRYSAEYREEMVAMSVPVVQRQEIRWIADRAARRFLNVIGRH